MMLLFAQDVSSLSGAGGWAGAGLLGLVLAWLLLKHLPDKDALIKAIVTEFREEAKEARAECTANTAKEREIRHAERNQAHEDNLKMATLLSENTTETRALAQETRALAGSVGNLAGKVERQ